MTMLDPGTRAARTAAVSTAFTERYGAPPGVVGVAPGRVNLLGEHTDYNAGLCLPVALPHATYAAARVRTDATVRISSGQRDDPWVGSLDDLGPGSAGGSGGWVAYAAGVLWALREAGVRLSGYDVHVDSTVPTGAGLSSSAALECAVATAISVLAGVELDDTARHQLVAACVRAEREVAMAPTGGMDQSVAMLAEPGTALLIDFGRDSTRHVPLDLEEAGCVLLVTDTRVNHALTDGSYGNRRDECRAAADALGVPSLRLATPESVGSLADPVLRARARHIVTENARVEAVADAVLADAWAQVGSLMDVSHLSMRDDFEISCPELDLAVSVAVDAGALGARMTGGGFGGSGVALVPEHRLDQVTEAIDVAFAAAGHRSPVHLLAVPSGGAEAQTPHS